MDDMLENIEILENSDTENSAIEEFSFNFECALADICLVDRT